MKALEIAFGQVLVATIVMTAAAVAFERPGGGLYALPESTTAIVAMLWLGILGTGVGCLLYFAIIGRWGATRATLIAYIMPIVAVTFGFLILDERLQPIEMAGMALIIGGVILVNARAKPRAVPAEASS